MSETLYEIEKALKLLSDNALIEIGKGKWDIKLMAQDVLEQRVIDSDAEEDQ